MTYGAVRTLRDMTAERPRFEILAEDGGADERTLVLARGDSFALFDRHGDFTPSSSGRHGLFFDGTRFLSALMLRLARRRPLLLSSSVRTANQGLAIHLANPDLIDPDVPRVPRETLYLYRSIELEDGGCRFGIALRSFDETLARARARAGLRGGLRRRLRGARRAPRAAWQRRGSRARPQGVSSDLHRAGSARAAHRARLRARAGDARAGFRALPARGRAGRAERARTGRPLRARRRARSARAAFSLPGAPRRSAPAALLPNSSNPAFDAVGAPLRARSRHADGRDGAGPVSVRRRALVRARRSGATPSSPRIRCSGSIPAWPAACCAFWPSHQAHAASRAEDAEPGKIVHEMRGGEMAALGEIPFGRYYGSVDVTPWFVLLAAAYHERTADDALARELWPNLCRRSPGWTDPAIRTATVSSSTDSARSSGLSNQGWKDSQRFDHARRRLARRGPDRALRGAGVRLRSEGGACARRAAARRARPGRALGA